MIAPYFVPRRRVGALRPFRFATRLKQHGWQPMVVTIKSSGSDLTAREAELLNGMEILEVAPPFDRTTPATAKKKSAPGSESESVLADWVDKHFPLDTWLPLFWINYRNILNSIHDYSPDLIWSTGDPWSGHWLGNKLSKHLDLPWIADFRDPWTLADIELRERSRFSSAIDKRVEKKVVSQADLLVFTSGRTEALYREHFNLPAEKSSVIYNSFDDLTTGVHDGVEWEFEANSNSIHLFFFGRFRRLSPADPVLKMLKNLETADPELFKKIRIHSFGSAETDQLRKIEEAGMIGQFVFHDPVLPEQSLNVLKKADILLLSTSSVRANIIPAKLWDYLAAGKPVLSIVPNPEVAHILEQSKAGKQFKVEEGEMISEFIRSSTAIDLHQTEANRYSEEFSSNAAAKKLAELMDQLTNNGR